MLPVSPLSLTFVEEPEKVKKATTGLTSSTGRSIPTTVEHIITSFLDMQSRVYLGRTDKHLRSVVTKRTQKETISNLSDFLGGMIEHFQSKQKDNPKYEKIIKGLEGILANAKINLARDNSLFNLREQLVNVRTEIVNLFIANLEERELFNLTFPVVYSHPKGLKRLAPYKPEEELVKYRSPTAFFNLFHNLGHRIDFKKRMSETFDSTNVLEKILLLSLEKDLPDLAVECFNLSKPIWERENEDFTHPIWKTRNVTDKAHYLGEIILYHL
jgi:hypothetical protein